MKNDDDANSVLFHGPSWLYGCIMAGVYWGHGPWWTLLFIPASLLLDVMFKPKWPWVMRGRVRIWVPTWKR